MKWLIFIVAIFLTLPSYSASLTQTQIQFILAGNTCCYSKEVLDSVQKPVYIYQRPSKFDIDLPPLKEPASPLTWSVFYALQVLDVYSTDKALQYDCVEEVNPILGKIPTANDIIALKVVALAPALYFTNNHEVITDKDLAQANYIMTAVVANNFGVLSDAKHKCTKIR